MVIPVTTLVVVLLSVAALAVLAVILTVLDAKLRPVSIEEVPGPCTCKDCAPFDWDAAEQQMDDPS